MSAQTRNADAVDVSPLFDLALDMRSAWNHATDLTTPLIFQIAPNTFVNSG